MPVMIGVLCVLAIAYRFFMLNLLAFMLLLATASEASHVWIGRAFFIWVSVFNLFVVSVFWSFIVDVFDAGQGKRLFGFLAAGATLGGIAGSALTSGFVEHVGQNWLLLASILLLEVAVFAVRRLSRISDSFQRTVHGEDPRKAVGGGIFAGMTHTLRSPYLLGIAAFILLYSTTSTFLYFQQATIAEANFPNRAARTAFFADIDFWVNVLTIVFQLFLTGRLTAWLGVTAMLCALPLFSVVVGSDTMDHLCELSNGIVIRPGELVPWITRSMLETILFSGPRTIISVSSKRTFTGALRRAIQVRDRRCQHRAGCDTPAEDCHVDHIIPLSKGGRHVASNLQILPAGLNLRKGTKCRL